MKIVCIPSLVAVLIAKEAEMGRSLNRQEVEVIRDNATAISVPDEIAAAMDDERGYPDLDPENVWREWVACKMRLCTEN